MIFVLKVITIVFFATLLWQYVGKYIFDYQIKNNKIYFMLFICIPVFSIEINDDLKIYEPPLIKSLKPDFSRINLTNRFAGRVLILEREKAVFKKIMISPTSPENFLRKINSLKHSK